MSDQPRFRPWPTNYGPDPIYAQDRMTNPDPIGTQRVMGVGRMADNDRAALVMLAQPLTDDQLRGLHDYLRGWRP